MSVNWTTGSLMRPAPCMPCMETPPPAECACALLIPPLPGGSPYASYSDAANAIAGNTSGCIGYCDFIFADTGESFSAAFASSTITASAAAGATSATPFLTVDTYYSVTVASAGTISIPFTVSTGGGIGTQEIDCYLLSCEDFSEIDYQFKLTGSGTVVLTVPAAGTYFLEIRGNGDTGAFDPITLVSLSYTATCSVAWVANPVIALYDDSGTTRQLEACPKMLIPPLTESSGDWYSNCANAFSVFNDTLQVADCLAYTDYDSVSIAVFTASFSGSLSVRLYLSTNSFDTSSFWSSINVEAGETITESVTLGAGTISSVRMLIYDYTGTLIETVTGGSSPIVSSAVPYTGRYIVFCEVVRNTGVSGIDASFVVSSSGAMSANPVQALYDVGLTCSGRLNCGDSCP